MHTGTHNHSQNHNNNKLAEIIRVCQVLMVSYLSNNRQHQRNKAECRAIYLHYYVVWNEQNKQPMSCDAQLAGKGECQSRETLGGKLSKRNGRGIVWSKPRVNCPGKCLGKCTWECLEELSQERFGIYVQGDVRMTMQDYKFTCIRYDLCHQS